MAASSPRLCYVTQRHAMAPRPLLPLVIEAIEAGIDIVQIREKDLATRELLKLTEAAAEKISQVRRSRGPVSRIVVNDRLDVALAAGAQGVHLAGNSMPAGDVRAALAACHAPEQWVGVSCHSAAEVKAAADAGADYVLLGPIFETQSKQLYGPPLGLQPLEQAVRENRIPVLALGGVTVARVRACLEAGACGVAGITIFQRCDSLRARVAEIREEIAAYLSAHRVADRSAP